MRRECRKTTIINGRVGEEKPRSKAPILSDRSPHKTFVSLDALRERARTEIVSQKPPCGWYEMNHPVESYMLHQGEKFVRRFDANTYLRILDAWQWFDLVAEAGTGTSRTCSSAAGTRS